MDTQTDRATVLYLASGSPRRWELMQQLNVPFDVIQAPIDEAAFPHEMPDAYVRRMAVEKAQAGFDKVRLQSFDLQANSKAEAKVWVVGGDTAVIVDNRIFGKPVDKADALRMLSALSGQTHLVLSGLAIIHNEQTFTAISSTQVTFKTLTLEDIEGYWETGEPIGKAGGYAIQGCGARFIKTIHGSYSGVVGLPLYELDQLLIKSGYRAELKGRLDA